jgi:hypothetical protein
MIIPSRRSFLLGLGSALVAAPVVVRAASLMPVRGIIQDVGVEYGVISADMYRDLVSITRKAFMPRFSVQVYKQPPVLWLFAELEAEAEQNCSL